DRGAPRGGDVARRGEQILGPVRDAVQRAAVVAVRELALGPARLREGALTRDGHHRVVTRAEPFEPLEERLGQRHRRDLPLAHQRGEPPHRREDEPLVAHGFARYAANGWPGSLALSSRTARRARAACTSPSTAVRTASSSSGARRSP